MSKRKLSVLFVLGFLMIVCVFLGIGLFSSRSSESVTASAAAPPLTVCSCTVKSPVPHRKEPTCTTSGRSWTTCGNCGGRIGDMQTLAALGHNYEWVVDKAATCTEEGSRHEECSRCHVTGATETIALAEHTSDMFKHVDEPTCTEKGYIYNLCTVCGARINVQMQNALGHSYSWVRTTSPTCTAEGVDSYQCSRCRDVTETRSVAALGHDYEWIVDREATCANSGSRHQECTRCNATGATETIDKYKHTPTNIQLVQPTCTAPGWKVYFCMECGQECSRKENGAALGHDYEWVYDKEASCSVDGLRHQKCSRCSSETAQETYRDAHTPGLKDLVAPTCTTLGYTIYRCLVCNAETSRGNIVPALGHSCNVPDATCTVAMVCTRCGLTIKPALGHDTHPCVDETCGKCSEMVAATEYHAWGEWQLVRQATATQDGEKMRTCGVCGGTQTQTIPKTGGSGENTGGSGSGGSGGSGTGGGTSGSGGWTDSILPGVSDSMKVIIAVGAGVLLFVVGIGIYFAVSGRKSRRKRR